MSSVRKYCNLIFHALFAFVVSTSLLPTARAQFVQQGDILVGTGAGGAAFQGLSVALSGDGNTAIVGGPQDNGNAGAAWVYTRSGSVWTQQGFRLVGTGAVGSAEQGISVALSADGNTAIVGGPRDNGNAGAAWVYTRSGGVWSQQGGKLVGTGVVGISNQGTSVALSADGNTAIAGGFTDNGFVGAVWVYTRTGGLWSQQGGKLVGTGAVGNGGQGMSVALSADGNTAIVGAYGDNDLVGAVWVYTRTGGVWSQQGGKLVATGTESRARQGFSVALSGDGNTAIVGSPNLGAFGSGVWVYMRAGGAWSQQGGKLIGTGAFDVDGGWSVALAADGNTAILGGPNAEAAWVFVRAAPGTAPSILTDGKGVINGGSYLPGNVISGSWVAIKGAGFTDKTMDWEQLRLFKG